MTVAAGPRMPPGIPYIVGNEFAERFCYYGLNTILAVYMTNFLLFTEGRATEWAHLFKSGVYFFPMLGAVLADVFWAKYRTVIVFSLVYCAGCTVLALGTGETTLMAGLFLVALGSGGIKPCVATNVGDQFTSRNQHLIERAFSYFYLSVNAASVIAVPLTPWLLQAHGPRVAFGVPGALMFVATVIFWLGRDRFAHVPPAGGQWLRDVFSREGLRLLANLAVVYFFIIFFWALWDQSNGTTWTLQAQSSLMDKELGFGIVLLPAQIQVMNPLLILVLTPAFSFWLYPLLGRLFAVTPLRKIGIGLFLAAASFVVIAWIESRIQQGRVVSVWWQILAYVILTSGEVMVSITALEFSYKQAPLRMKSFVMALYLLCISLGNFFTAAVNSAMVEPLQATAIETGAETWVQLPGAGLLVAGQKIDFQGATGIEVAGAGGAARALAGTYLVAELDPAGSRVRLVDAIERRPVVTAGAFTPATAQVSTYRLVGPMYFLFFAAIMAAAGVLFVFVALAYRERVHVRQEVAPDAT